MTACAPWVRRRAAALLEAAADCHRLTADLRAELALLEGASRLSGDPRGTHAQRLERLAARLDLDLPDHLTRSTDRSTAP